MEWNRQLIEMAKLRSRSIMAWFYIGYRQNLDFCEPDVSRFLYRQEVLVCTENITRIKTKGGATLRLTDAISRQGSIWP